MIEVAQFLVQVYLNVIKPFFLSFVFILVQFLHVTKYAYCAQTYWLLICIALTADHNVTIGPGYDLSRLNIMW